WNLDAKIDGTYARATRKVGLQKREEEYIASIPTFDIKNTLTEGHFKLADLPKGLDKIAYRLEAKDPDGKMKSASISIHDISVQALNNYIKGYVSITDFNKIAVQSDLKALFNLQPQCKRLCRSQTEYFSGNQYLHCDEKWVYQIQGVPYSNGKHTCRSFCE
ncbi:MAG: hypothetical protein K0R59_1771, partial [Sphingobacterium sp.]|nr:hypothetical protein [Sphingobacterium sp.]